jgi:phosphatidylglycerol---prolipoprotein diacylglyceryl transferase
MRPAWTWDVDPVLLRGPGVEVRWYTVLWWMELALAFWLLHKSVRRGRGDAEEAGDLAAYLWIGLIAGARLGHCLFYDLDKLAAEPAWLFRIWTGGLSSHGAAAGVLVACYLFTRRRGMSLWEATDRLAYSAALSAILHRASNLMNSEIVGKPTDGTWGVSFPRYDLATDIPLRHPTQLYEMALGVVVLFVLDACDRAWRRELRPRAALSAIFLLSYFGGRFIVEFWKVPEGGDPAWPLDVAQLLSIPFIVLGAVLLAHSLRRRAPSGWLLPA